MRKKFNDLRIVFMGTPEFAVASLDKLVNDGANVVSVITAPDKPAGRGLTIQQSAVKKYAVNNNLPVLQPERLKDPAFIDSLKKLNADIQVVVAFRMLPEIVWNMPPFGTINVHGSLLPQYRGAAPINWAIINGEKFTGVTTFRLKHEIDTGNILLSKKLDIADDEDAGHLHDRMMIAGAEILLETLHGIADEKIKEVPQEINSSPAAEIKHASKIFTDTRNINWYTTVDQVYNLIRGLAPYPAAFTTLDGKTLKIFKAAKIAGPVILEPGTHITDSKTFLHFCCVDGYINVLELQLEGKKKMHVTEFLKGYHFKK